VALPSPSQSGIAHIVMVLMENRSFDHFLGWVPGADGLQAGLTYKDATGKAHATHHLTEWQGCGFNDPDHSYEGGRIQYAGGKLNGFRKGTNDDYALGYYTEADVVTNSSLVHNFTVCDRWFCSILAPTYPNRIYTHAAASDRIENTMAVSSLPTIWDRLDAAGVSSAYYFSDAPVLALFGEKHLSKGRPIGQFYLDAQLGNLPQYSYLDPFFVGEDQGGTNDDHPHADIRRGQAFLSNVVKSVLESPQWSKTVLIITYDEWGGFFDHVRPPRLPDLFRPTAKEEHNTAGFRVPAYVVSPFARRGHVAHNQYDHSSMLKMVEWRFGLKPLTPRDAAARNIAEVLDFSAPNAHPPQFPIVLDPGPHICQLGAAGGLPLHDPMWTEFMETRVTRRWRSIVS
jgi:phospholipase C